MSLLPQTQSKKRELTERQSAFLDALFGDAQGNPRIAGELAGYAPSSFQYVVTSLKNEIIDQAENILALHSPQAAFQLISGLEADGGTPGMNTRMDAAKEILNRVGVVKKEKVDINMQSLGGLFILPAKVE